MNITQPEICNCEDCQNAEKPCHCDCTDGADYVCQGCQEYFDAQEEITHEINIAQGRK